LLPVHYDISPLERELENQNLTMESGKIS